MKTFFFSVRSFLVLGCACLSGQSGRAAPCSYTITVPGMRFALIANQCSHLGGNTFNAIFPSVPVGSQITKFNNQTGTYDPTATSDGAAWHPNLTLDPGEGAFFYNPLE